MKKGLFFLPVVIMSLLSTKQDCTMVLVFNSEAQVIFWSRACIGNICKGSPTSSPEDSNSFWIALVANWLHYFIWWLVEENSCHFLAKSFQWFYIYANTPHLTMWGIFQRLGLGPSGREGMMKYFWLHNPFTFCIDQYKTLFFLFFKIPSNSISFLGTIIRVM